MHDEAGETLTQNTASRSQGMEIHRHRAIFLTVREAATWIEERRGLRPSSSTIYAWIRHGVGGHRLASIFLNGVTRIAEDALENFCQARDWPAGVARASLEGQTARRRNRQIATDKYLPNQQLLPLNWGDILPPEPCSPSTEQGPL